MMRRHRSFSAALLAGLMAVALTAPATAQSGSYDTYLNYDGLSRALQNLAGANRNLANLESLATTAEGRNLWLLTLGNTRTGELDSKPALLIVANLEANHLIGSMTALYTADYLLSHYGRDDAVTRLLDTRTIYIFPRLNPDGAERVWTLRGHETSNKPHPSQPDRGGLNVREFGRDLNGDGLVTLMRVRDPEGDYIPDPSDPRLMRRADRTRAERGLYKIYVEGIDPAMLDAYLPSGSDGVNLNRNWPHEYPFNEPHAGPHQVSEVETRALADFAFNRTNIAAVLTFSPYDNLRSPQEPYQRTGPATSPPQAPMNILPQDNPYFSYIQGTFVELTGLTGRGATGERGSWPQFAYFHVGLPSFTTPVWTVPEAGGSSTPQARGARAPSGDEARWLAWFEEQGIEGFVDWTPARHPTLGEVEVGGFVPNARVNPPAARIAELADKHARFAVWLGNLTPRVRVEETRVEARGDGVFLVTAVVQNDEYLPTHLMMGVRVRTMRPITVRLMPTEGMTVLTGNIQQQFQRLEGMGGRHTVTWLVQARPGTRVNLEVFAERAGGLLTTTLTLR